jgi:hypothetical protein
LVESDIPGGLEAPVTVAFKGGATPEKGVVVTDAAGNVCPATLRDGELVFMAKSKGLYTVKDGDGKAPRVALEKKSDTVVDVVVDGKQFTSYIHSNDNKKPFLWPLISEGGAHVTRDWPMDKTSEESKDHPHHKSVWSAYGELTVAGSADAADCWDEGPKSGFQKSGDTTFGSGDAYGWVAAKNVWEDINHKPVWNEAREYRFYATPEAGRYFDLTITFTAAYGDVKFGDTKEGGIVAVRMRPDIDGDDGGIIRNALGGKGEKECWGKASPWCDYYGNIANVGIRGIAIFDNPSNLRHPSCWHVRDYGLMAASVFGLNAFTEGKANGEYTLKNNESITFKYRVLVHSGDTDQAKIAEQYAAYAKPAEGKWQGK